MYHERATESQVNKSKGKVWQDKRAGTGREVWVSEQNHALPLAFYKHSRIKRE